MTMPTPPIFNPEAPVVHLSTWPGATLPEAVCGRPIDGIADIMVDTLDDDPVVDCPVCRELEQDNPDPWDYEPED